ncbi:GntR family transcriptional regulator [Sphaerisporangium sp. TRM90804]|uniref:GntR family transcriptional regulator n=1 Tax=Sphaerisporangium sp. TRM90804 TaxID=3031113 RepID=UPI00244728C6|nr:GntR family transcriptional regulator [Sphaerisporangium sp. TRM90804]MDH2429769.1 GntR family transcriptional regulator [Sphaerisporangium sp. TRM90804]
MGTQQPAERQLPSRRIADDLRRAIETGELAPGARLPSERDLAGRYGTARNTAREAIRLLADGGLVIAEHGRGVFVRRESPLIRLGNDRYSHKYRESGLSPFLLECAKQGKTGRFEVLSIEQIEPPAEVARHLRLSMSERSVLVRENVFFADADPVHRVTTYIPWEIAEDTGLVNPEVGHPYGIHGIFEERGHVMTRLRESVSARMPKADEARYLQLPPGVPVLDVMHISIDQHGEPYELTRFVMRADLTGLLYDTPIE